MLFFRRRDDVGKLSSPELFKPGAFPQVFRRGRKLGSRDLALCRVYT